ncbi:MAG: adenosylcobinamide amidohydrolase [Ornithinimicrobium sp.]|uniref:adenosylcobinamide amidohydrolase n=1 Tax=Ornithinimicrobium sp. TaxID=1977084 RepID=UPI0017DE3149|nr:adenosylcobinamide amidohydrolase [Actinomycetota bacterium]
MVTRQTTSGTAGPRSERAPNLAPPEGEHRGVLWWRLDPSWSALSSAPVGGGWNHAQWLVNVGVPLDYARTDLVEHAGEIVRGLGLLDGGVGRGAGGQSRSGPGAGGQIRTCQGIALFTAADVSQVQHVERDGVAVSATVGVTKPTWAADASGGWSPWTPGTINLVVQLPVALHPGAMVNAVMTATEAKAQALLEAGVPGTGTASDAVVVLCPGRGDLEPFAGPRSPWGSRLALGVHDAVRAGLAVGSC